MKEKFIKIDNNSRIEIIPDNYALQHLIKTKPKNGKKGSFKWITDGYFPNLVSLATEYLNNAPNATSEATGDIKSLIEVIKGAEKRIKRAIK